MCVYFLSVEEDSRERGRQVEGGVRGIVCGEDEAVGKNGWGKVRGEEGFVIDVGSIFFGHYDRFSLRLWGMAAAKSASLRRWRGCWSGRGCERWRKGSFYRGLAR